MSVRWGLLALVAGVALPALAHAEPRVVAIAPLSTLGAEDTSAATKQVVAQLEQAVAALPDTKVIAAAAVVDAIKKAKRPQLKVCEGDNACLSELGKLVGATVVIAGEVGGLGDARVVYLNATETATAKELRSTTLAIGAKADPTGGAAGAMIRLLDPDRYRGTLRFAIDVTGATVYVNGSKVTPNAKGEIALPVGPQAVRITHPEYHDFVKFVDVPFNAVADVPVGMQQYPIVEHDVKGKPINRDTIRYVEPPVWRRWYVVGPAAVVLGVVTGIVVGAAVYQFPDAICRKVGGANC